ncbi:MAG: carboxypeptidase-like regulatory domain-containing protein, partial [Chloroflexi bacterium]
MRKLTAAFTALVLLLSLQAGATPALASNLTISGHVTDKVTGAPLANVCVTLGPPIRCFGQFGSNPGLHTDATGFYLLDLGDLGASSGGTWDMYFLLAGYDTTYSGKFVVSGPTTVNIQMPPTPVAPPPTLCVAARTDTPTQTVYLPNITRNLGGVGGWYTPFIVQNTGV